MSWRRVPTHFLALQLGHHPPVQSAVATVQAAVTTAQPMLEGALVDPATAHLTILVMALDEECNDISRAAACLQAAAPVLAQQQLLRPVSVTLRGLSHFNNKVLFLEVLQDSGRQQLLQLGEVLRAHFGAHSMMQEERRPFEPHLTIAKLSRHFETGPKWRAAKVKAIPPEAYEQHMGIDGGTVEVREVQLCAMGQRTPGEYYEVHGRLSLAGSASAGAFGGVPRELGLLGRPSSGEESMEWEATTCSSSKSGRVEPEGVNRFPVRAPGTSATASNHKRPLEQEGGQEAGDGRGRDCGEQVGVLRVAVKRRGAGAAAGAGSEGGGSAVLAGVVGGGDDKAVEGETIVWKPRRSNSRR